MLAGLIRNDHKDIQVFANTKQNYSTVEVSRSSKQIHGDGFKGQNTQYSLQHYTQLAVWLRHFFNSKPRKRTFNLVTYIQFG